jgi:undecaprenyl-diphosphatase
MTDFLYSIFLGAIQGLTEFLPISSTGHLVIFRDILGLNVEYSLAFDAVLQLATAVAVVVYFRKDLINLFRERGKGKGEKGLNIKNLIIATIPAVILGLLFQGWMETTFRSTLVVAIALLIGSLIMWASERFIRGRKLSSKNSFVIGLFQSLALLPGMSRSGMTIAGGYFMGLKKESAIRFAFLLSIPIIGGSGFYKLLEIVGDSALFSQIWLQLLIGSISAFIFGIWAIDFLIKFLKTHTFKAFIIYRVILAVLLIFLSVISV